MSTTHDTLWLDRTSASSRPVSSFIRKCRDAYRESRERQKLRATLSGLSDMELKDFGTTRGEIDYTVSHRNIDPRCIRPGEWPNREWHR